MKIFRKSRKFYAGYKKVLLKDCGSIILRDDEQVTFIHKNSEYDVAKKNWGYYATPSLNGRLKKFNFRTFVVRNTDNKFYIMLVHKEKYRQFRKYISDQKNKMICEITEGIKKA